MHQPMTMQLCKLFDDAGEICWFGDPVGSVLVREMNDQQPFLTAPKNVLISA